MTLHSGWRFQISPVSNYSPPRFVPPPASGEEGPWDAEVCRELIGELEALRKNMLDHEASQSARLEAVSAEYRASARNLLHYLVLRREDRRLLQEKLAWVGTSSLGHAESHVLGNLDKVLGILYRITGQQWEERSADEPVGIVSSQRLLDLHTDRLLGGQPVGRAVRIMVTLPSEAALDYGFVHQLVGSGMDVARINCAHDGAQEWEAMAAHVRRAARAHGCDVRVLMDLGGPKLRTGPLAPAPAVLRIRPRRDEFGRVRAAARVGLRAAGALAEVPGASASVAVDAAWIARVKVGDTLELVDARGARRTLRVLASESAGVLAECDRTAYLSIGTEIRQLRGSRTPRGTTVLEVPLTPGSIYLRPADRLRLTRSGVGWPVARDHVPAPGAAIASIACTLPEVFAQVCVGERIWFDDGRIGGVIRAVSAEALEVEVTQIRSQGDRLMADKGINLPDSQLDLPALTAKDIEDLAVVARCADLVGLSFVQRGSDIDALRSHLEALGGHDLGVILKIETRRAFENLPELLLAAMNCSSAGIMIARGDLAVECGYERLAEVQEEILWAAEAAHMPVIWATQVLETLAKTGRPSRAEITDAAMGERAECVMLNKGPHILEAMRTLDDILKRMQGHQSKKRSLLRALGSWSRPPSRVR